MSQPQNEFRRLRRGVMIRKDLLSKCYKESAKRQLASGEKWSQTRLIESILSEALKKVS